MSPPRLFVPHSLHSDAVLTISQAQTHYLCRVMRKGVGDPVVLFNGQDGEWNAEIAKAGKNEAALQVTDQTRVQAPEPDLWLLFAPLKRDATDMLIEKATELGVSAICPVMTDHTNTSRLNDERLLAIATEAAEQSERLTIPVIHPARPLTSWLHNWPEGRALVAALESPRSDAMAIPAALGPCAALLIGPEGGFSEAELTRIRGLPAVKPAALGRRILRAETAAIAGLALVQAGMTAS